MNARALALSALTVFCWGLGAVFDKLALGHLPPREVFVARLYVAFTLLLIPMIVVWEPTRVALMRSDRRVLFYLLGSVVFTYGGMFIYYKALVLGEASRIVPFTATYPLLVFLLALIFLKESFSISALIGVFLVAGGAYLLSQP